MVSKRLLLVVFVIVVAVFHWIESSSSSLFTSSMTHPKWTTVIDHASLTDKAAIATLVSNETHDVANLCVGLQSFANLADKTNRADVLVFHDSLSKSQKGYWQNCTTTRRVLFPLLEHSFESSFPKGAFDPVTEQPNWSKRSKWSYHQMIRFWITQIWQHPAIEAYDTLMRLDSDACFQQELDSDKFYRSLPYLPTSVVAYHANEIKHDPVSVSYGFGKFAHAYVKKHKLKIQNPKLWRAIPRFFRRRQAPMFYNNFEVVRIDFMKRPDVKQWHDAITEQEPFGVYRYRWGDAIVRYATVAIFLSPQEIVGMTEPKGYNHGGCSA